MLSNTTTRENEKAGYESCHVCEPVEHKYESTIVFDYRSLYPEPFEEVLKKYELNSDTLFEYKLKYKLVNELFNKKMSEYEFSFVKKEFIEIVKEIKRKL